MKRRARTRPLWRVSITTTPEADDAISEMLRGVFDELVSSYTDVETQITSVAVYLERRPRWAQLRTRLHALLGKISACGLNIGTARATLRKVTPEKWAESWKRHFKPIEVSDRLLVKPSWSRRRARPRQATLILDPGLSFGTGQHPTTLFCLTQLASRIEPGQSVLDIGTGSGILAIAAALLGAGSVDAFDFDPDAVRIARENAGTNKVSRRVRIYRGDITRDSMRTTFRYDIVCANLISTLLMSQHKRITRCVKPDGILLVSGILKGEFIQVRTVFCELGFRLLKRSNDGEWASGAFRRGSRRSRSAQ